MDKLAAELGIDPIELRLLNALGPGDALPTGQVIDGLAARRRRSIRRAAAIPVPEPEELPRDPIRLPGGAGNTTRGEGVRRGVGFAVGFKNVCYSEGFDDFCAARVVLRADGSAEVHCAAAEVGQGVVGGDPRRSRGASSAPTTSCSTPGTTAAVGLGRLGVGLTDDVDGRGRGARRLPRGARGAGAARRRRGRRRARVPASANVAARSGDRPDHGRARARRASRARRCASSPRWTSSSG